MAGLRNCTDNINQKTRFIGQGKAIIIFFFQLSNKITCTVSKQRKNT